MSQGAAAPAAAALITMPVTVLHLGFRKKRRP
ncbi:hypothetical protein ABIE67_006981 [Streptomyces sp. V4I8]